MRVGWAASDSKLLIVGRRRDYRFTCLVTASLPKSPHRRDSETWQKLGRSRHKTPFAPLATAPDIAASRLQQHGPAPIHSGVSGTPDRRYMLFPNAWSPLIPRVAGSSRCPTVPGARHVGPQLTEYGPQRVRSKPSCRDVGDSATPILRN